jgi:predicted nucleotidyltransferase
MKEFLKHNRARINKELSSYELRKFFSPSSYAQATAVETAISSHVFGKFTLRATGRLKKQRLKFLSTSKFSTTERDGTRRWGMSAHMSMNSSSNP